LATVVSAGIGFVGGLFIGFVVNFSFFQPPKVLFDDREFWRECGYEEFHYLHKNHEHSSVPQHTPRNDEGKFDFN
jgi:hypothetical protein